MVECGPLGLKQRLDVWGEIGPPLRLMKALKDQLDPRGTLNPGRFVGGLDRPESGRESGSYDAGCKKRTDNQVAVAEDKPSTTFVPAVDMEFDRALLKQCVHCGLCLDYCPTYRVLGTEMDSPRGRIYQIKAVYEGKIEKDDPHFAEHMYACLDCRACQTVCPPVSSTAR